MGVAVHVVPIGDTFEHTAGNDCRCRPELNGDGVWEHHSFDGREEFERGGFRLRN